MLLDRLQQASFKGIPFLVENSSITFGQKTVVHQFPNADRTEVEYLGTAEDTFSLDIYIHSTGEDYIDRRDSLKRALESSGAGLLIHPYQGSVICSVVGRATMVEQDQRLGVAKFTVTFQKTSESAFPTAALLNSAIINDFFESIGIDLKSTIEDNYNLNVPGFKVFSETKTRLDDISDLFIIAQSLVPLTDSLASDFNSEILNFKDNIVLTAQTPALIAQNLSDAFDSMNLIAADPLDNITMFHEFFDYADDQEFMPTVTVEQQTKKENTRLLRQFVQVKALTLAYNAIAVVDFEDDEQMNYYDDLLENQYQKLITFIDNDVYSNVTKIRNEARIYFESQDVRRVVSIEVDKNPLTKIAYLLYESLDDFNKLYELNGRQDPSLYSGTIKVLTEA